MPENGKDGPRNVRDDVRGEQHGRAVLTEEKVRLLRRLHQEEGLGSAALYRLYGDEWGISEQALYAVISGRTWKHLD